jgi:hypothetical protein
MQERYDVAVGYTTLPWIWCEVPAPWEAVAVGKWLGSRAAMRQANQTLPDPIERLMNKSP